MTSPSPGVAADPDDPRCAALMASDEMEPIAGTVDVDLPIDTLWELFKVPNAWPSWNGCFFWAHNRSLERGRQLVWIFQPIRWWMLYKMPAMAKIVELVEEPTRRLVTWKVVILPGFYARHTYHLEALDSARTRFGSWEKAQGFSFRCLRRFWTAHFTFVRDASLAGARALADRAVDPLTAGGLPVDRARSG
ncbi:MAG: hypothetical protein AAGC60_20560 [Acidobacteriota bacterium]